MRTTEKRDRGKEGEEERTPPQKKVAESIDLVVMVKDDDTYINVKRKCRIIGIRPFVCSAVFNSTFMCCQSGIFHFQSPTSACGFLHINGLLGVTPLIFRFFFSFFIIAYVSHTHTHLSITNMSFEEVKIGKGEDLVTLTRWVLSQQQVINASHGTSRRFTPRYLSPPPVLLNDV